MKPKTIGITGASGFVGQALVPHLQELGYQVISLTRAPTSKPNHRQWLNGETTLPEAFAGLDAVVHLAGNNIASGRWSSQQKQALLHNRTMLAQQVHYACEKAKVPHLIIASAVGFYGQTGETVTSESTSEGHDFAAQLCQALEKASPRTLNLAVTHARLGVVLNKNGGALEKMWLPFKFGLGGKLGHGQQPFCWVSRTDAVRALTFCLEKKLMGAVNITAPNQSTNASFTCSLGRHLKRPNFFHQPSWLVKLLFGNMGEALLLNGRHVVPHALQKAHFTWQHTTLKDCLRDEAPL